MIWAVVPMKDPAASLRRLGPALDAGERRALATSMLADVLEALVAAEVFDRVAVVAAPGAAAEAGQRLGAVWIDERPGDDHSSAVAIAARRLAADGVTTMLTITADVPLVTAADIRRAIAAHGPAPALTMVPSRAGTGSNCLVCSPPDVVPFAFGGESLREHTAAARRRGVPVNTVVLPHIGLDVDTPADLARLFRTPSETRSRRLLERLAAQGCPALAAPTG